VNIKINVKKGTRFAVWNYQAKVERTPLIEEEGDHIECYGLQLPILVEREFVHHFLHTVIGKIQGMVNLCAWLAIYIYIYIYIR
jgi:hypothetical protein